MNDLLKFTLLTVLAFVIITFVIPNFMDSVKKGERIIPDSFKEECDLEGGVLESKPNSYGRYCVVGDEKSSDNLFQVYCSGSGKGLKYYSNSTYDMDLGFFGGLSGCITQREEGRLQ